MLCQAAVPWRSPVSSRRIFLAGLALRLGCVPLPPASRRQGREDLAGGAERPGCFPPGWICSRPLLSRMAQWHARKPSTEGRGRGNLQSQPWRGNVCQKALQREPGDWLRCLPVVCVCANPFRDCPAHGKALSFPASLSPFIALQTPPGTAHLCCYGCNMLEGFGRIIIASISLLPALWFSSPPRPDLAGKRRLGIAPSPPWPSRGVDPSNVRSLPWTAGAGRQGQIWAASAPRAEPRARGAAAAGASR